MYHIYIPKKSQIVVVGSGVCAPKLFSNGKDVDTNNNIVEEEKPFIVIVRTNMDAKNH